MTQFKKFTLLSFFIFILSLSIMFCTQRSPVLVHAQGLGITSPTNNGLVYGDVPIYGTAVHPQFLRYELYYKPEPSGNEAYVYLHSDTIQVVNGQLGLWYTSHLPDGIYTLRLRVVKQDSNYDEYYVYNLNFSHTPPTSTPFPTPIPIPTSTSTATPLPTLTPVPTFTPTPLPTLTPVPTFTPIPLPTFTLIPTFTPIPLPTLTPIPTFTPIPLPTLTPIPTFTQVPTFTPLPTLTFTPFPTATPPPTYTPLPTYTLPPTETSTFTQAPLDVTELQTPVESITNPSSDTLLVTAIPIATTLPVTANLPLTATLDPLLAFATQISTGISVTLPTPTQYFIPTETPIPTVTPIPSVTYTPAPQPTPIVGQVVQPDVAESTENSGLRRVSTPFPTQEDQVVERDEADVEELDSANDETKDGSTILNPDNVGQTSTIGELPATIEPSNMAQLLATPTTRSDAGEDVRGNTSATDQSVDNSAPEDAQQLGTETVMDRLRSYLFAGVAYGALIGFAVLLILIIRWFLVRRRH